MIKIIYLFSKDVISKMFNKYSTGLFIIFLGLKVLKIVNLSWLFVLLPFLLILLLNIIMLTLCFILISIGITKGLISRDDIISEIKRIFDNEKKSK